VCANGGGGGGLYLKAWCGGVASQYMSCVDLWPRI